MTEEDTESDKAMAKALADTAKAQQHLANQASANARISAAGWAYSQRRDALNAGVAIAGRGATSSDVIELAENFLSWLQGPRKN